MRVPVHTSVADLVPLLAQHMSTIMGQTHSLLQEINETNRSLCGVNNTLQNKLTGETKVELSLAESRDRMIY